MIRTIFIPEHIGGYYLISKRVVGIEIGKTEIRATITVAKGKSRVIEQYLEEKIEKPENELSTNQDEKIINALAALNKRLGNYDALHVAISSSNVIFKELSLPFQGENKIKMVIPFEIESLLPFSLDNAVIDSVTTHETTNKTDLLVTAVKKDFLTYYLNLFTKANMEVEKLTVDMLELYGLYKSIAAYQNKEGIIALVDLGLYSTQIALIINNQLKFVRSTQKGIFSIASTISESNNTPINTVIDNLFRFGNETTTNNKSRKKEPKATLEDNNDEKNNNESKKNMFNTKILNELLSDIQFTINGIINKISSKQLETTKLNEIIWTGIGADIPRINEFTAENLNVQSEIFQAKKVIHNETVQSSIKKIPNSFIISMATSLLNEFTQNFNLQKIAYAEKEEKLITKQILAIGLLLILIIGTFSVYSFFSIRNLKVTKREAQSESISELRKTFKLKESQTTDLETANKNALKTLQKVESTWAQLLSENRYSLLNSLLQLSKCINVKSVSLDLTRLIINADKIQLYGSVPSHDQLIKLQNQLKCPLFKNVPRLHEYDFRATPIILTINKETGA